MTSRVITTEADREGLVRFIQSRPLPITVEVVKGKRRSVEQNKLQRRMVSEIAEQLGDTTPEEVRAYCKLHIGVPILRDESESFRAKYDEHFRGLSYETKLALMGEPFDFPVTRLMNTSQKTRYIEGIMRHYAEMGIYITMPGDA